jgi:hypothetical protein
MYLRAMKSRSKGNVALILAALFFAFAVFVGVVNNGRCNNHCGAHTEDQNLMLVSGAIAIGFLVLGLVRRYQPARNQEADHTPKPPNAGT